MCPQTTVSGPAVARHGSTAVCRCDPPQVPADGRGSTALPEHQHRALLKHVLCANRLPPFSPAHKPLSTPRPLAHPQATGNQFPRQPQSPCVCLSVKANFGSHFTCAAVCYFYVSIHSRIHLHICLSLCVIKPGDQTGTLQLPVKLTWQIKWWKQTRTDKAATVFHLHKVGHVQWKNLIENIFK